jgi:hemolysin activation/secretion protein
MKRLTLLVFVLVIVAFSQGFAQLPSPGATTPPMPPPVIAPPMPPLPIAPTIPSVQPTKEKSLDQLLDELETLRKQKAEMEKKEQELVKLIQQKADKHVERMKQLGVVPRETSGEPKRIGRVLFEGFAEKDEKKLQNMLDFTPGQILEFPMLEQARVRLMKAGYQMVLVEVQPKQSDSQYLDILVKVGDKENLKP